VSGVGISDFLREKNMGHRGVREILDIVPPAGDAQQIRLKFQ